MSPEEIAHREETAESFMCLLIENISYAIFNSGMSRVSTYCHCIFYDDPEWTDKWLERFKLRVIDKYKDIYINAIKQYDGAANFANSELFIQEILCSDTMNLKEIDDNIGSKPHIIILRDVHKITDTALFKDLESLVINKTVQPKLDKYRKLRFIILAKSNADSIFRFNYDISNCPIRRYFDLL